MKVKQNFKIEVESTEEMIETLSEDAERLIDSIGYLIEEIDDYLNEINSSKKLKYMPIYKSNVLRRLKEIKSSLIND